MFGMNFIQALLILLFMAYKAFDTMGPQTMIVSNILVGVITGAILGDPSTGLEVGANLALMSLGVVGLGGASVPNYVITTCVTTIVAVQNPEAGYSVGLTIGLSVGMLNVYLDILIKTVNCTIAAKSQELVDKGEFNKGINIIPSMLFLNILQYVIPVALVIFCGQAVTELLVSYMPAWLYNGLQVAGKLLPVTGMAILLNYMPLKKHFPYFILGYVCCSYLGLSTLATSLIGIALAVIYYQRKVESLGTTSTVAANQGGLEDE